MTEKELKQNIGKIILMENRCYKWMVKLLDVTPQGIIITQGMDIYPMPNAYLSEDNQTFNQKYCEPYNDNFKNSRLPQKKEINLYRQYTRELRLLGTNKSNYGRK